jgi:hypothetical protein
MIEHLAHKHKCFVSEWLLTGQGGSYRKRTGFEEHGCQIVEDVFSGDKNSGV